MKNANLVSRPLQRLIVVLLVALFAGCGQSEPAKPVELKTVNDFFPIKLGDRTVRLQFAVHMSEMEHGLMDRRDLGRDDGMIFVYAKPQGMSFWMHNTPTALDIGFCDSEGVLREIYQMMPFDETTVKARSDQLQFAIEMNQNWYHDNGVKPGAKLDLTAVVAALKARGFEPRKFGLKE